MSKIHTKNGFEYHCERWWLYGTWSFTWYFRPIGRELWTQCLVTASSGTRKADVEKLLADPQQALEYYDRQLAKRADVAEAEKHLERCKQAHEHYESDAFDPGGRRNNPGRVRRDLARAADSGNAIRRAEEALEDAKRVRAILEAGNHQKKSGSVGLDVAAIMADASPSLGATATGLRTFEHLSLGTVQASPAEPAAGPSEDRRYWALISNPLTYRTLDSLRDFDEEVWTVTRGDIEVGDRVIIWQSKDKSGRRGIVALGEVLTAPTLMEEPPEFRRYWVKPEPWDKMMRRVWVRYARAPKCPRWMREDGTDPVLEGLSVTRARGGGVYRLTPEQWEAVLTEVGGWPEGTKEPRPLPSDDWQAAVEKSRARAKGQGFSSSPEVRRAVENLAMDRAETHFVAQGYTVKRLGKPYDLLCTNEGVTLYVEVKGTQMDGTEVLLTPNEVAFAREHRETMALFVLHSVSIESVDGTVQASGGTVRILQPWDPDAGELLPVGFTCILPQ
ncbi:EVE domain-containing protein [Hyalangium versicolor]|uniref:EVE domain-containing protein n=1 Tax=Hyalangium versicolor TaxID=2861190 RepID=UPI001CCE1C0F|nr:EVE domain-containing protein [Hyalangium versicolor]